MRTVAEHLAERARTHPAQVALQVRDRAITFAELHADSDTLASGLQSVGIVAGTRTALMVPPGLDFFSLTFALFKIGAVPVLIDPGMGMKNLKACLAQAEPEAFIGSAKAHLARRLFGWAKRSVRTTVNAGAWRFFCTTSTEELRRRADPVKGRVNELDSLAAILFTSGSTGIAKGVEYTHSIFAAQIELLKATYCIEPGEIDYCTFPLFALFGAALGMTCVVPDMDASRPANIDPVKVRGQLRRFRCTNLFGSPAVLKRLANEAGADPADYVSVRRVISAGAPATPAVLEQFTKLLPAGVPIFTPYGATEGLPVANISSAEILNETRVLTEQGRGVCVGKPVAGMEVMVIPITDGAIAELDFQSRKRERRSDSDTVAHASGSEGLVIGEFVVRGPVVTPRYFRNPTATALAKIRDPATGETLHRMGDVGYIDELGRLWFCGRKSHRVVTAQGTLFTDMVEPVFNTVPGVARSALVGITRAGVTYPVICIEMIPPPAPVIREVRGPWLMSFLRPDLQKLLVETAKQFQHTARLSVFLEYPTIFPVDVRHNSKIFREKLTAWSELHFRSDWSLKALRGEIE